MRAWIKYGVFGAKNESLSSRCLGSTDVFYSSLQISLYMKDVFAKIGKRHGIFRNSRFFEPKIFSPSLFFVFLFFSVPFCLIFPLKQIPLLQLEGWGINPALREAFLRQVFSHIRGKRTVRHAQV